MTRSADGSGDRGARDGDRRLDPARWRRRLAADLALVAGAVVVGAVLVVTDAVEGAAERFEVVLGDRVDEVYFALVLVLVVVVFAGFRRWQEARNEHDRLQDVVIRLEETERWRAAMVSTLAHDIRSPLTTVGGTLQLLQERGDRLPDDRREQLLAAALHQTHRVKALTADLLATETIEEGVLRLAPEPVRLSQAVAEATLDTPEVDIRIEVPDDLEVFADPRRLEQILINLITNARRHGEPPIVVCAWLRGDMVELSVRDHGSGVPARQQPALFERFSATDREPGSVGLGLWIVRQLTAAHGGAVTYQDAEPGACFVVTLPSPGRERLA